MPCIKCAIERPLPTQCRQWREFAALCEQARVGLRAGTTTAAEALNVLRDFANQLQTGKGESAKRPGLDAVLAELPDANRLVERIVDSVLSTQMFFPNGTVPHLKAGIAAYAVLTAQQVACLICHAVLGTYIFTEELWTFSFDVLFGRSPGFANSPSYHPFALGVLHYLDRVLENPAYEERTITFARIVASEDISPASCDLPLPIPEFRDGGIEASADCAQVDFANKHLGGGVLMGGCVQEEIRFGICNPELLAGMVLCDDMLPNEAISIQGVEQFSSYTGYGRKVKWGGDYVDNSPRDKKGNFLTRVIAIDAVCFGKKSEQFSKEMIMREIKKAYAGFIHDPCFAGDITVPIATGRWGCGVFNGDVTLKFMIQWIACSMARKKMVFHFFSEDEQSRRIKEFVANFDCFKLTLVKDLYKHMMACAKTALEGETDVDIGNPSPPLVAGANKCIVM